MRFQEWAARYEVWKEAEENERKWTRRLEALEKEREQQLQEANRWKSVLDQHQEQLDKLEGLSLSNLFYTLLGKREQLMDERQKDLLEAKLKYDEAVATLADIDEEMKQLRYKRKGRVPLQMEYERLIAEKEKMIHDQRSGLSEQLYELVEQKETVKGYVKELKEAIRAGEQVLAPLNRALDSLKSAENWGVYDMLGGGMIATAVKHGRINDGKSHIHEAQRRLRQFEKELKDVQMHIEVEMNTDGMVKFADFFFDGLIVDWIVQGRIRNSQEEVNKQIHNISSILSRLRQQCAKAEQKLAGLQQEYKRLVVDAV